MKVNSGWRFVHWILAAYFAGVALMSLGLRQAVLAFLWPVAMLVFSCVMIVVVADAAFDGLGEAERPSALGMRDRTPRL